MKINPTLALLLYELPTTSTVLFLIIRLTIINWMGMMHVSRDSLLPSYLLALLIIPVGQILCGFVTKRNKLLLSNEKINMVIVYVFFFIFFGIIVTLGTVFLGAMQGATAGIPQFFDGISLVSFPLTYNEMKFLYIFPTIVKGFGDGIILGFVNKKRFADGLKHSGIMILISGAVLGVMIGG